VIVAFLRKLLKLFRENFELDFPGIWVGLFLFAGEMKKSFANIIPVDLTLLAALGVVGSIIVRYRGGHRIGERRGLIILLLWFATFLPGLVEAVDHPYGKDKSTYLFTLTLMATFTPILLIRDRADLRRLLNGYLLFALVMTFEGAKALATTGGGKDGRLTAFESSTIALGRAACVALVFLGVQMWTRKRLTPIRTVIVLVALIVAIGSGSRGPLVSAIMVFLLLLFVPGPRPNLLHPRFIAFAASVVLILPTIVSLAPEASTRRIRSFFSGEVGGSELSRVTFAQMGLEVIKDNPLGTGWGSFGLKLDLYPSDEGRKYPHNIIVETSLESGWICGVATICVLAYALMMGFAQGARLEGRWVLAATFLVMVNALISGDVNDNRPLFFFVGMAVCLPWKRLGLAQPMTEETMA
jgi:O-antigen ligase